MFSENKQVWNSWTSPEQPARTGLDWGPSRCGKKGMTGTILDFFKSVSYNMFSESKQIWNCWTSPEPPSQERTGWEAVHLWVKGCDWNNIGLF